MCVRLTVRAGGQVMSWPVNEWSALAALAALSAEPETMEEFFAALRRYQPDHRWDECGEPAAIEDALGSDEPSCVIDLDSRSVLSGGGFELPDRRGAYQTDEDDQAQGFHVVWIDMPDDWLFETVATDWLSVISERARAVAGRTRIDTRDVLFGEPMLEFVAEQVLAAVGDCDDDQCYERIRAIHADWLMTPRDDLLGRTPREVLLGHRHQIDLDIQHRSEQWSMQGFAPPPLEEDSAAHRFGGYGITEIVIDFDLMRSLLERAWEWVRAGVSHHGTLARRLAEHRDTFLNHPPEKWGVNLICRELIESERRRMPVTSDGSHLFDDCPICQATAEGALGSGPMFMVFDGHHLELEDEFVFSLTESRAQWEKEQEDYRRFSEEMDRKRAEREASDEEPASAWEASFVDWDSILGANDSPISPKMAIGFPLAELVAALSERDAGEAHIDAINAAFARFRRAEDRVTEDSAAEELRGCLEDIADSCPDLTPRCADLQSRLDEVIRSARGAS
jgi:hypothetical protein